MEKEIKRVEMSENVADPTGLGLLGLAIVCFVVSTSRVGWSGPTTSVIVPWAVLLGSLAQLIASYFDFKKNNPFGSVVFGAYGLFWSAMAGVWLIQMGSFGPEIFRCNTIGIRLCGLLNLLYLWHHRSFENKQGCIRYYAINLLPIFRSCNRPILRR